MNRFLLAWALVAVSSVCTPCAHATVSHAVEFPEGWDVQRQGVSCQVRLQVAGMNNESPWTVTLSVPVGAAQRWHLGIFNDSFVSLQIPAGTEAFFSVDDRLFATTALHSDTGTLSVALDATPPLLTALASAHAIGMTFRSDPADKPVAVAGFNLHAIPAAAAWLSACAQSAGGG